VELAALLSAPGATYGKESYMPYYDPKLERVRVRTRERCRTCCSSAFICPLRGVVFTKRGLDVQVWKCPNYEDGRKTTGNKKYRRKTIE
jgi:hypothetical protein